MITFEAVFYDRADNELARVPVHVGPGEPIRVIFPQGAASFELVLGQLAI